MVGIAERDFPQIMFTEVGFDRLEQPCQKSTAHHRMSTVKDSNIKRVACQVPKKKTSEVLFRVYKSKLNYWDITILFH